MRALELESLDDAAEAGRHQGDGDDGVSATGVERTMAADPAGLDGDLARVAHGDAGLDADEADRGDRGHVAADHRLGAEVVEDAAVDHGDRTAERFLGGLEQEDVTTGQVLSTGGERCGGAEQLRGVGIVTTGVHDPLDL